MLNASCTGTKTYPPSPPPDGAIVAQKEGYTGDAFCVSPGARFVGDDGFVVPRDFGEFFGRFPDYVRNWVRKHVGAKASAEDVEDWAQELLLHLCALPAVSKFRYMGKNDVVQTFDPMRQYGASERRFRNYINSCLANRFSSLHEKQSRNPLSCPANVSLSSDEGEDDGRPRFEGTEEYVHSHSAVLRRRTQSRLMSQEERRRIDEFTRFVEAQDPDAALVLSAFCEAGTFAGACRDWCADCRRVATTVEMQAGQHRRHIVGLGQNKFSRSKGKLKELAKKFTQLSQDNGAPRPLESVSRAGTEAASERGENL